MSLSIWKRGPAPRYCPLAIVTPEAGVPWQTFIRRHIVDLMPNATAVLSGSVHASYDRQANAHIPFFKFKQAPLRPLPRGTEPGTRRFGWPWARESKSAVKRFLRRHGVRVMIGEHLDFSLEWLEVARELGIRFFAHGHGYDLSARLRDPIWCAAYRAYNDAAGVVTISRFTRDRLIALGLKASKVHVVPYGVEVPDGPAPRPERQSVRCLAVGRMIGKKAPLLVLDAFRKAVHVHKNLRLDFVGMGPLLLLAENFVRESGLETSVTLHGHKPNADVLQMMRESDVFVQHSITNSANGDEEGLPVAILEAMAWALPVVSTRHAGIPEAVQEGVSGYLVDEGDTSRLAERILELARDADMRRSMGQAGWALAKRSFSWELERARLREILGVDTAPSSVEGRAGAFDAKPSGLIGLARVE